MNEPALEHRNNRFDALRLVAACAVFWAHADFLYRLHLPVPFAGHSLGSLAVYVFFFVSGFLVCQSWRRQPELLAFTAKRVIRIYPGLVVASVFSVVVIGGAMTTLTAGAYWAHAGTWHNLANNASGLASVQVLPGVFESNPFARTVNGSLWTIRYELAMYAVLCVLAVCARRHRIVYPAAAVVLAVLWFVARTGQWDRHLSAMRGYFAEVFRWGDFCGFGVCFFIGATFAAYQLRPRGWMVGGALACAALAYYAPHAGLVQLAVWALVALGTYCAAFLCVREGTRTAASNWDVSYGVYIYAFPVQQAFAAMGLARGWPFWLYAAASAGIVAVLAIASWWLIERPAIRAGHRWLRRRYSTGPSS